MDKLIAELQRLYGLAPQAGPGLAACLAGGPGLDLDLVGPDGGARALLVDFARAADWEDVARLCRGLQEDFELPAPALSVSAGAGFRVWLSLAEAVPAPRAAAFLDALRRRYLPELPAARVRLLPGGGPADRVGLAPALDAASGKWSAFIDPGLGSMFIDEPGLDMAPGPDKQADLLAGLASIRADDFERALAALLAGEAATPAPGVTAGGRLGLGGGFADPKSFLLAVMNDPSAGAGDRIRAARALLPYFETKRAD